jgi:hypothetical protein
MAEERVECRTPTPGGAPTRIPRWKFEAVRAAILAAVPDGGDGLPFADLPAAAARHLSPDQRDRLGSLGWHVTTVKLELEVRGELRRLPGSPQRLLRA